MRIQERVGGAFLPSILYTVQLWVRGGARWVNPDFRSLEPGTVPVPSQPTHTTLLRSLPVLYWYSLTLSFWALSKLFFFRYSLKDGYMYSTFFLLLQ